MGELLRLRYVVIDDIDFTPKSNVSFAATLLRTGVVDDLVVKMKEALPSLQAYDHDLFKVLKIIKPVPPEMVDDVKASETALGDGREESLSLAPILRHIRDRTAEAKTVELANEYVKFVDGYAKLRNEFNHEDQYLISAIVVLQVTPSESSSIASYRYPF
jgi:hypothetical protein